MWRLKTRDSIELASAWPLSRGRRHLQLGANAVSPTAQLWHTGAPNAGTWPRPADVAYFGQCWMKRLDGFLRAPLPPEVRDSGDPLVRQLFGLELDAPSVHGADYHAGNARWH